MPQHNKQTWLILSHAFNMDGRAASQTITDKIPHLINLGIEPIIVSGVLGQRDEVLEHHQVLPAFPVGLRFDLRHYLKRKIANPLLYRIAMSTISLVLLPFYLLEKLLIPIESTWSWAITAFFVGSRIIKSRKPVLVYSTGGAYSAHIAGYWLAKRFGIPWIAEIHDPMVLETSQKKSFRERFLVRLEKIICSHADIVWWFTEMAMERAKKRHPQLAERGHYVLAGVDAPDFNRTPYSRQEHLVLSHFGSLSTTRNLQVFLDALRNFLAHDVSRAHHVQLHIYGGSLDALSAGAIRTFPYPEIIKNFGRLETDPITGESGRIQVLKRMNAADCLLLLHGIDPFCEEYIPSKLYEYLWTQRPILALVHRNPQLTGILHEFNHWAVDSQNIDEITQALEELYQRWTHDDLKDYQAVSPYTTCHAVQEINSWTTQMLNNKVAQV
jgi:glycosyltransferase involved in cell wall biosynthesis